jgi:hypothetical protein
MVESEPRTVPVSCAECGTRAELRQAEAGTTLYITEILSTCKHGLQGMAIAACPLLRGESLA